MWKTSGRPFLSPWCGRNGSGTCENPWVVVPCVSPVSGAGGDAESCWLQKSWVLFPKCCSRSLTRVIYKSDLKKKIPCSVAWCCLVPSWGRVEWLIQMFICGRGKRGTVFWATVRPCFCDTCSAKQMWVLPHLETPIRACYVVPLGSQSRISGVTPYCWMNGEGNSCV